MPNIKLILQYDGTNYSGWQSQNNANSIQGTLKQTISQLIPEKVKIIGCSRTDAGVHALEYICNFECQSHFERWVPALNAKLPQDIRVLGSQIVPSNFNSRFNALGKTYIYKIYNGRINNPILRNYSYFVSHPLDLNLIESACRHLIGKHDFSAFTNNDPTRVLRDKICNITELDFTVDSKNPSELEFKITGNRFLYKMVRIIIGTLIYVGTKKIKVDDIPKILESKNRQNAGITLPAHGLYLYKVICM